MNTSEYKWTFLDKLILVAGHAVYIGKDRGAAAKDKSWILQSFQRGEPPKYIEHIRFAVELAASQSRSLLVFSGGPTRRNAGKRSEAQSYVLLANQFHWWQHTELKDRVTTEDYARDSFENVLFGIARFRECTGHYPSSIEIVNWAFKRERFNLHCQTFRWPCDDLHFKYHCVNNPVDIDRSIVGEAKTLAAFKLDPFGTEEQLVGKRKRRNPFNQVPPYSTTCPEIACLLDHTTRDGRIFQGILPWGLESSKTLCEKTAHSWKELLLLVQEAEQFLSGGPQNSCHPRQFWYRGHNRDTYTLTPSLFRYCDAEEKEAVLFRLYSQTRIGNPGNRKVSWKTVFKMQHYGIPTRLLDWTTDLKIAVFFAVAQNRERPCIFVLNPLRLNILSGIEWLPRVPKERHFDYWRMFSKRHAVWLTNPLAIEPTLLNNRLSRQRGRFTIHGTNADSLERQRPQCLYRICLDKTTCEEALRVLRQHNITLPTVFPDHEGVTKYVISEADLKSIPYDEATASRIRTRLKDRAKHDMNILMSRHSGDELFTKGVSSCNLDSAYIPRKNEALEMSAWLKKGPSFLFVTGEAGVGKTNFTLHTLLCRESFREKPSIFFSFKLYGEGSVFPDRDGGEGQLAGHLYEIMLQGKPPSEQEKQVARQMISEGDIVLALDGLDELARVKSEKAVEQVARELDDLFGGSPKARVIVTCRHHIYAHLHGMGALGRAKDPALIKLDRFPAIAVRNALRLQRGKPPKILVEMARVPLFYEMIRRARDYWPKLCEAGSNRARLEEAWFKIMLDRNGYPAYILDKLGTIAGKMLHDRKDLVNANSVDSEFRSLLKGLSAYPYALFVEEFKDTYSFSHQSLREFVLAWCVADEIKNLSFALLKSSGSFDYEGHEFYDRVRHLIDIKNDVIDKLPQLLDANGLDDRERNHVIRNLFEMLGELCPNDNALVKRIAEAAVPYLRPTGPKGRYFTHNTKYNIVRCLERIHWSAPRPYIEHIQSFQWWLDQLCRPPRDQQYLYAHAIRGFHRPKQEATSLPPIVYKRTQTPESMRVVETLVSDRLIKMIRWLNDREMPEDGIFLGVNCTLALIRWLPNTLDLAKIKPLLALPHMTWQMKQNLFFVLWTRYRTRIPACFRKSRLFSDAGKLEDTSEIVQKAFENLIQ